MVKQEHALLVPCSKLHFPTQGHPVVISPETDHSIYLFRESLEKCGRLPSRTRAIHDIPDEDQALGSIALDQFQHGGLACSHAPIRQKRTSSASMALVAKVQICHGHPTGLRMNNGTSMI